MITIFFTEQHKSGIVRLKEITSRFFTVIIKIKEDIVLTESIKNGAKCDIRAYPHLVLRGKMPPLKHKKKMRVNAVTF